MNVSKLTISLAAFAVCFMPPSVQPAQAQCDCAVPQRCTITPNIADFTSGADYTVCTIRTTAGYGSVAYTLTTPRGEQYRIENPVTIFDGWFINGTPGVRVASDGPTRSCFRTIKVQICFGG
jgi:hypothetical protein